MDEVKVGDILTPLQAMRLAIRAAKRGVGFVAPNPLVGCVIVDRSHRFLAVGYHSRVGGPHAEIEALKNVRDVKELKGGRLYVTLEPCAHEGRTPSCAKHLAQLPLGSVVFGLKDPNPLVAGQGAEILKAAGIEVVEAASYVQLESHVRPQLVAELEDLAEVFLHNMRAQAPFVALKLASSLDGQMALKSGESKWITREPARLQSHWLRAHYDAVVIGRRTFQLDDPSLNIRHPDFQEYPNKVVILDPNGASLPSLAKSKLLKVRPPQNIWVVTGLSGDEVLAKDLGIHHVKMELKPNRSFEVPTLLKELWSQGLKSLFVEGGASTISAFLVSRQAQRLHVFMAPVLIGAHDGLSWTRDLTSHSLSDALRMTHVQWTPIGEDLYVTGRLSR